MTNYEKNKELIDKIWGAGSNIAIVYGSAKACDETKCESCDFFKNEETCSMQVAKWLVSEYKEPQVDWSKVNVDTPILVRNSIDNEWYNRYFAKYENNLVYAWNCGSTSWSAKSEVGCTYWNFAKLAEGAEKVIEDSKELGELVKVAGIVPETAGFIYKDLPPFSGIDYDKIEKALGFKLFIWQKTYIERGEYRQSGRTTAVALRTLLTDIEKPLELQRPRSAREKIEQQQLIDIYKKLQAANVPCRKITKIHK